jgi:hypothetical protein
LLTSRLIELEVVKEVSYETVRQVLKKNELKPWLKRNWCIPPEANAEFVYHMEDILEVYRRPSDPLHPQVCLDEGGKQLVAQLRDPLPMQPGHPQRVDYEYESIGK